LGRDAAPALDGALTAGVAAGLLTDADLPGSFRFENPMLREALLERVIEQGRRRELNLVAATARQTRWADHVDAHALEIARHLHAAGLLQQALEWYRRYAAWARSAGEVLAAVDAWRGAEVMVADGPRDAAIEVALGKADAHLALAEFEEARDLARRAERIAGATPPAEATRILATVANRAGETRRAQALYAESIERFAAHGDAAGQAHAELGLADLELRSGRPPEAERLLRGALERLRRIGDARAAAEATLMLGRAALDTGLHEEASDYVARAIADWDAMGDRLGSARGRLLAGEIALAQRRTDEARTSFDEAREALLALGDRHSAAVAGFLAGLAAEASGADKQARRLFDDAVHHFEWIGDQQYAAVARLALGRLDAESGAWDRADNAIRQVVDRDETERIDDPRFVGLLIDTGRLAIFAGRDDVARRLLKTAAFKLGRIADGTGLYDRVDEVQYLLHELENDSGLDGSTALSDLVSDDELP
jgi:tetratricopeptide (TPR) repeat protein